MTGVVTRGGRAVGGGRVGGWQKRRKEMDRINAAIHRGRTLPMWGYEFVRTTVNPDGTFALENLKAGPWFGPWFFVYEEPSGPPTIVGPVTITSKDRTMAVDIVVTDGGRDRGSRGDCAGRHGGPGLGHRLRRHDPEARGTRVRRRDVPPGGLAPGHYGLKAGHDTYTDPHVPRWNVGEKHDPKDLEKLAEPWQGAVVVTVEPGKTARGVVVDFRPPGPLVEPSNGSESKSP